MIFFLSSGSGMSLFQIKKPSSTAVVEHWIALEVSFSCGLGKFFNEFYLKLQGKTAHTCQTFVRVNLFQWQLMLSHFSDNVWITSNVGLLYRFPTLAKVKTKSESSFPHKFAAVVVCELKLQQYISDFVASAQGISIFQNPFNCAIEELPPNFQLWAINLQYNDV